MEHIVIGLLAAVPIFWIGYRIGQIVARADMSRSMLSLFERYTVRIAENEWYDERAMVALHELQLIYEDVLLHKQPVNLEHVGKLADPFEVLNEHLRGVEVPAESDLRESGDFPRLPDGEVDYAEIHKRARRLEEN